MDIQPALTQGAGIGRYARVLAENLGRAIPAGNSLSLFYFDFSRRCLKYEAGNAEVRAVRWCPGRVVQQAWKLAGWPPFDWFAGKADVYHFPNFIIPPLRSGRTVVTIHDASFVRLPELAEARNLRYLSARIADTIRRADAVITDSRFSADEIVKLLHAERGKVHAIYPGIQGGFGAPGADAVQSVRRRWKLDKPYLLNVGTLEPRKNHRFLVEVFEKMTDFDGYLVIAGRPGWKCGGILDRIRASSRAADIRLLGDVADDQLAALYAGAELFLFPSLYEGFGFPPLEAMACGTPVVSSTGGSLREVAGGGAVLLEAFDSDLWAETAKKAIGDKSLIARGRQHAGRYTWEETARRTWKVYEKVFHENRH